ncbi:MAG: hypothetical protein ACJAT7_003319 [Psychromonas sp.]|jgi:hypothetical protein|uniref:pilus assembly protein TadG-related protein n=1 Tax=Psychromonas sp. TaxID=1884585 RepID=UPI0039E4A3F4
MASYINCKLGQPLKKQQGNILVMFTIGLFVLIAMAALAIDGGHLLLNKSRLQNIADAAALHAAKTLDEGGSHQDARVAVIEIIGLNLAHNDNFEIKDALLLPALNSVPNAPQVTTQINVDFSERPDPFIHSTSDDADYVKVEVLNLNLNNFLANIMGFSKRVSATALAGKSPAITDCPANILPLVMCSDPDGSDGDDYAFGLPLNDLYLLKITPDTDTPIGPGNFQLLNFPGNDQLKELLAGGVNNDICEVNSTTIGDYVTTKPGNTVAIAKGMNTRFGIYKGEFSQADDELNYPRDWNTCRGPFIELDASGAIPTATEETAYHHDQYQADIENGSGYCPSDFSDGDGDIDTGIQNGSERRIFNIFVADCSEGGSGTTDLYNPKIGCFFLTQEMLQTGLDAYIVGELIKECSGEGTTDGTAEDNPGPHKIVLYHVPDSSDS